MSGCILIRGCWAAVFVCVAWISAVDSEIHLEKLDTLYLPYSYTPVPLYGFGEDAAEQSAYDSTRHLIFTVGGTLLHVIDAADPRNLRERTYIGLGDGAETTDVETCGEFIFVGVDNKTDRDLGKVFIFNYDTAKNELLTLHEVTVGPLPDMILPSRDCRTVFVGLEAEAYVLNDVVIDPEGGFGILQWDLTANSSNIKYRIVDFRKFNDRAEEYVDAGVRFIYRDNNNTLAQDLEPEYITLNEDETLAFVCLQENNAIAVVNITDLDTADVLDLYPIGQKMWANSSFDASDKDKVANMQPWPVYGNFQPDAIHFLSHGGEGYIITANEGDSKGYSRSNGTALFEEEKRGSEMVALLDDNVTETMRGYLEDKNKLGRLKLSTVDGKVGTSGKYDKFFAYGGRSFSMIRTSDMSMVYDSGDIVERSILERFPPLFNCDSDDDKTPWEGTDKRSDDKGPECESLAYGKLWGKTVIFMGNERPGTISIFSIDANSTVPQFESVNFGGVLTEGRTWQEMYERRTSGDVDPEDVRFISAEESGTGEPVLLVSGSVSGTVSMYAVRKTQPSTTAQTQEPTESSTTAQTQEPTEPSTTAQTQEPTGSPQPVTCSADELKCRNRNACVKLSLKCDGVDDCGDNTDEAECAVVSPQPVTCSADQLKCRNRNACVKLSLKCDGVDDCGDNTDEAQCAVGEEVNDKNDKILSLSIAAVCVASLCVLIVLGVCCILRRRSDASKNDYEMKTQL